MNINDYKLVKIGWADAIENENTWHTLEEATQWHKDDDWIVHQTGWLLEENKDYIVLFSKFNDPSGGRPATIGGLFKVPKPWIKYKIELECPDK